MAASINSSTAAAAATTSSNTSTAIHTVDTGPAAAADDEQLTIFGYGSLLSVWSCRRTSPSARNHRVGVLPGWQRVFSLVSVSQIRNGNADPVLRQLAAVAIAPCFRKSDDVPQCTVGALFEIGRRDFAALCAREHRYEIRPLTCYEADDATARQRPVQAYAVLESTDARYRAKCDSEQRPDEPAGTRFHELVGQHYSGSLWGRRDIFPVTKYLRFCVAAARVVGGAWARDNFLDASFLADRETSIRCYLLRGAPGLVVPGTRVRILPDLAVHRLRNDESDSDGGGDGSGGDGEGARRHDLGRAASCRVAVLAPYLRVVVATPAPALVASGFARPEDAKGVLAAMGARRHSFGVVVTGGDGGAAAGDAGGAAQTTIVAGEATVAAAAAAAKVATTMRDLRKLVTMYEWLQVVVENSPADVDVRHAGAGEGVGPVEAVEGGDGVTGEGAGLPPSVPEQQQQQQPQQQQSSRF